MKRMILIIGSLICLLVISGCTHRSYHPWLGEEFLVNDDRMAGVWQGDCSINENVPKSGDIVIIRPVEEKPTEGVNEKGIPKGYYTLIWYADEKLEEPAQHDHQFVSPSRILGGLYEVEGVLLAQLWGSTSDDSPLLLSPMHVLYKVEYKGNEMELYELHFSGLKTRQLAEAGLLLEEKDKEPHLFFSKTEDLTAYILNHIEDDGFFSEKPTIHLKRISDLRSGVK